MLETPTTETGQAGDEPVAEIAPGGLAYKEAKATALEEQRRRVADPKVMEKMAALREKAQKLREKATRNLTEQFGSVPAARSYASVYEGNAIDPHSSNERDVKLYCNIHFAQWNLEAIRRLDEVYDADIGDGYDLDRAERGIDDLNERIEGKAFLPKPLEDPLPRMDKLSRDIDAILLKVESKYQKIGKRHYFELSDGEQAFYLAHMELESIKLVLDKKADGSYYMTEDGVIQISYMPSYRWTNAEMVVKELEKQL